MREKLPATLRKTDWNGARSLKRGLFLLAVLFSWASVGNSLLGRDTTHVVTNLNDGGPGSLREEIAAARNGDTISFAVRGTIVITNGELLIDTNLRIIGPGATKLSVSALGQSRVLEILPDAAV